MGRAQPDRSIAVRAALAGSLWAAALPAVSPAAPTAGGVALECRLAERELVALAERLHPTLAANRKRFPGRLGPVEGFGAGADYPQIWLRDSATLLPLARWLEPHPVLVSWLEEHLAAQQPNGALHDWIAAGPPEAFRPWAPHAHALPAAPGTALSADTNTTESDQEASAVRAAGVVFEAGGGPLWLLRPIAGTSVLSRLDRALERVWRERRDARHGLIVSALTADWGDVSPAYADARAIYLDERTPRAVGLYTNALFAQAAGELAGLHAAVGDGVGAARWQQRAQGLCRALASALWQPARGFYRMHLPLAAGAPDTGGIFALGGHAHVLLAGCARGPRALGLLELAERRWRRYGFAAPGAVLLPPLPRGMFPHPMLATPWRYQNGGQWDWIAGRFVLAGFEVGRSEQAYTQLVALARRAGQAGGLYEWYDRQGRGQGSPHYAGAAGALGQALVEGLFGVRLRLQRLDLRVRLGGRDGSLSLRPPGGGTHVLLQQRFEPQAARLVLEVDSNATTPGTLAVRVPSGWRAVSWRRTGQPWPLAIETHGADVFATTTTEWGRQRFELQLARRTVPP